MSFLYFAYGSNLCLPRLRSRVPGVEAVAPGTLRGYRLAWHKRSRDGSGKCSIVEADDPDRVHGGLYRIAEAERHLLDRVEGLGAGYDEASVVVRSRGGDVEAWTYVASPDWIDDRLRPFAWYRDLVVHGARSVEAPQAYLQDLEAIEAVPDPDPGRRARHRRDLPCSGQAPR